MASSGEYHAMTDLGHELGVMFAFGGFMVLSLVVYAVIWKGYQKRLETQEARRRERLQGTGIYDDAKYDEKGALRAGSDHLSVDERQKTHS